MCSSNFTCWFCGNLQANYFKTKFSFPPFNHVYYGWGNGALPKETLEETLLAGPPMMYGQRGHQHELYLNPQQLHDRFWCVQDMTVAVSWQVKHHTPGTGRSQANLFSRSSTTCVCTVYSVRESYLVALARLVLDTQSYPLPRGEMASYLFMG